MSLYVRPVCVSLHASLSLCQTNLLEREPLLARAALPELARLDHGLLLLLGRCRGGAAIVNSAAAIVDREPRAHGRLARRHPLLQEPLHLKAPYRKSVPGVCRTVHQRSTEGVSTTSRRGRSSVPDML
eukprot:1169243-Rhodomonas_salina.1